MKFEISNRLASWLRDAHREDLAKQGEVEVSQLKYLEVFTEVRQQHSQEDIEMAKDRALFRILTHVEWGPTRKLVAVTRTQNRERWLKYAWAIAVLILLLLLLVRWGRAQERPKVVHAAQGQETIRAEKLEPPVLTVEQKFRIRDLQHRYDELRLQMAKLELDKAKLEKELSRALSDLNGVAYDVAHESKVDTSRYNLNIDTLLWEKRK